MYRLFKKGSIVLGLLLLGILVIQPILQSPTLAATISAAFNRKGISPDANVTSGNFDGGGASYSQEALAAAGITSGATVTVNNIAFTWPTIALATNDNWLARGQTIPVSGSTSLAFLGAASGGTSTGTATITYTDATTQQVSLSFNDWCLDGKGTPLLSGESIAASMSYRNVPTGKQTTKNYVFFIAVPLTSGKTAQSVTLPATTTGGGFHVFAIAAGTTKLPPPSSAAYNKEGISSDTNVTAGNFDGGGASYSQQALATAGFTSGTAVTVNNVAFTWPTIAPGTNDNWLARGQTIFVSGSTSLAFLGAASGGTSTGTATITYTDATTQQVSLSFNDWCLDGKGTPLLSGESIAASMTYRNVPTGKQNTGTYVFFITVPLTSGKTAQSVTLPATTTGGGFHVFAIAAGTTKLPPPSSAAYNKEGISSDTNVTAGNFDGGGASYSQQALAAAGFTSGAAVTVNSVAFTWPTIAPGTNDNWLAQGQTIFPTGSGTSLAFLGSASGGDSTGAATITYTDTSTQSVSLGLSDWCLNGIGSPLLTGESIAATMPYRNLSTGKQSVTNYVFFISVPVASGKTVQSVALPATTTGGGFHVFAISVGTPNIPPPNSAAYNNEGISPDTSVTAGNFDGGSNSYSQQALAAAGFTSGAAVTVNSIAFTWPTTAVGTNDNWEAHGQTIFLSGSGSSLSFLGAGSGGSTSGTATITYSDNSTQVVTLSFNDWNLDGKGTPLLSGESIAATLPYRNTPLGKQTIPTYLFFISAPLHTSKTIQSITLPATVTGGALHIFAMATNVAPPPPVHADWPTYLGNNARTGYNGAETTLNSTSVANAKVKWSITNNSVISTQPAVVNNIIYSGSWDGNFRATDLTGKILWTTYVGTTTTSLCSPSSAGVAGTATIAQATIQGTLQTVVFVSGGDASFYALNAATGAILWSQRLGNSPDNFIWDSSVYYAGNIYIGISSFGDCPGTPGAVFKLDAATGTIQSTLQLVPANCNGAGVWGSPSLDEQNGLLFVATGNGQGCTNEPYAQAVVSIQISTMTIAGSWTVPINQVIPDGDFGSTPTLFTATINGVQKSLLGVGNKNGVYYVFDRLNISAGPVWQLQIARSGSSPDYGDGTISPSAWDGTTLYAAGGVTTINGQTCSSSVRALDPSTGAVKWAHCFASGYILAGVTAIPGVVFAEAGNTLYALSTATGAALYSYTESGAYSNFYGAPTIVNGMIFAGNADGHLLEFGL